MQGGTQFYDIATARFCYNAMIEYDHDEGAKVLARNNLLELDEQERRLTRYQEEVRDSKTKSD